MTSSVTLAGAASLHFPFIPEVKLGPRDRTRSLSIIRKLEVPIIAISLGEFYNGTRALRRLAAARRQGLSSYLCFDGRILLTTDVRDSLCEHFLRNPVELRHDIEALDPTYVTTPDASTYYNVPASISLLNICRTVGILEKLVDVKSKFVGLALGSNTPQLLWHARILLSIGCNVLATPLYELRRSGHDDLARHRVDRLRGLGAKVLALSCSPSRGKKLVRADYYSSWSWSAFKTGDKMSDIGLHKLLRFVNSSRNEASQRVFA